MSKSKKAGGSDVAGIDVGAERHYVSVSPERDSLQPVRSFGSTTPDLALLADWLWSCGVRRVVLESTGVYWVSLFAYLESRGFAVTLVDPRRLMQAPARKSDVLDCQWLRHLAESGLLVGSHCPSESVSRLRTLVRLRGTLVSDAGQQTQRMHKALTLMNVKLSGVLSDTSGQSGLAIIDAILSGQRDAASLAALKDRRCKKSEAEFVKALTGYWREDHLYELAVARELFGVYQSKLAECHGKIEAELKGWKDKDDGVELEERKRVKGPGRNDPGFDVRGELHRVSGEDLTAIEGISEVTGLTIISEIGTDVSKWSTVKRFANWLGLCPGIRRSGDRTRSGKTKGAQNRVAQALRVAAMGLLKSKTALGAYLRRMRARIGGPKAITATAHKLARLVYYLLKHGKAYVVRSQAEYEARFREQQKKSVERRARELGFELKPLPA